MNIRFLAANIMIIFVLVLFAVTGSNCFEDFPFRNVSLSWEIRVNDLLSRLTLEEVVLQLTKGGAGKDGGPAPAIPRLGIKPYAWNTECLRGAVEAGPATSFPEAIGLAASFDSNLVSLIARATGLEVRAKNNNYTSHGVYTDHSGLSCFSPVINIMRHPLWGRNQETYGEDPYLTGELARSFVRNLQGNHSRYVLANAVCKHFAAHSGPEDKPVSRLSFDALVSSRDLMLTYLPQFRKCIDAGAMGVMCSYNRLNGVPNCANKWLLTDILRQEWNFTGYVVSDEGALEFMVDFHKSFKTFLDAAVAAIDAGCNLELSPLTNVTVYSHLMEAVKCGRIKENRLRELLFPLFYTRFRLGEFDPISMNPYTRLDPKKIIQSVKQQKLSLSAAMKSFVLLKNDKLLPLNGKKQKLALIGPFTKDMSKMYGDYSADRMPHFEISLFKGLQDLAESISVGEVCTDGPLCLHYNSSQLISAITGSDLVVLTLGTGIDLETENVDRWSMALNKGQQRLITETLEITNAPIILLVFSASPVDIREAMWSKKVCAIVWCGYPAQTAGLALSKVLQEPKKSDSDWTGISGRLPFTWYQSSTDLENITNYKMSNLTYRYYSGIPLFPFGYGLGYSEMKYENLSISKHVRKHEAIFLSVIVINIGKYKSDEVVQVYISWPKIVIDMPRRQLVGFRRVTLDSRMKLQLNFTIEPEQTQIWSNNRFKPLKGILRVSVGGQQPNQRYSNVLQANVTVG